MSNLFKRKNFFHTRTSISGTEWVPRPEAEYNKLHWYNNTKPTYIYSDLYASPRKFKFHHKI